MKTPTNSVLNLNSNRNLDLPVHSRIKIKSKIRIKSLVAIATLLVSPAWLGSAAEISLESAPPVVVKTVPAAGATDVDPALTEIKVTYSKAMTDGNWSWSTWGEENYPETTGEPRYLSDKRTCVLPVKLQPGKFYAIWLNSDKFKNFQDAGGQPAVPYLLAFTTAEATATKPPKEVVAQAMETISQCAEGDPRVTEAMNRLRAVPNAQLVANLVPYLDSSKDTIRRSAIYVLWRGGLTDIGAAVAPLEKQLTHHEDLTRGMAALALGQNHISGSFEALAALTKDDPSGYARRCGAYALGLLGDARAKKVLQVALKDSEALVRNNAQAALDLLKKAESAGGSVMFGEVVETVLKSPDGRHAELLDLDTGRRATRENFGENDRETHAWIRASKLDVLGVLEKGQFAVLCMDMVIIPAPSNSFSAVTASEVITNWNLAQGEPNKITGISPAQDKTDTFFFRTRENGLGLLQLIGESSEPRGVKIRYKLIQGGNGRVGNGKADSQGPSSSGTAAALIPIPKADELPGKLVFHGHYRHRSRGSEIATPSELWVKETQDGELNVLARLPGRQSSELASSDAQGRFTRYQIGSDAVDGQAGYSLNLELNDGRVKATRRGVREDWDGKELAVPTGARFDPNSRPDSYCAANVLLRIFEVGQGETKEFRMYDWDNSGEALMDYTIRIKHAGKEKVEVPAGAFEANHLLLTQTTSADTWFKKRAGHVTDFWVLDNHIIVRVLRHREPYEMLLLDYDIPEKSMAQVSF